MTLKARLARSLREGSDISASIVDRGPLRFTRVVLNPLAERSYVTERYDFGGANRV